MKIRLTPELSYIIGFWRKRRTKEGIGVEGDERHLELFSQQLIEQKLTTPDRLLHDSDKLYFYHTAYRRFFQEVESEQLERYKYLNDYAASYLAGTFDSCGGIDEKGYVYFTRMHTPDEMLLLRLGFGARRKDGKVIVERPVAFLAFIKNYVKLQRQHKAFEIVEKSNKDQERK